MISCLFAQYNNFQLCDSLNSCSLFNSQTKQQLHKLCAEWEWVCVCLSMHLQLHINIHRGAFTVYPFTVTSIFILYEQFSFRSNRRMMMTSTTMPSFKVNYQLFCETTHPVALRLQKSWENRSYIGAHTVQASKQSSVCMRERIFSRSSRFVCWSKWSCTSQVRRLHTTGKKRRWKKMHLRT